MKVLGYRGTSLVSKLIRWQTRSAYSHVAIEFDDGVCYEAWHVGGVRRMRDFRDGHTVGTEVDVFNPIVPHRDPEARAFLDAQVGKKYDFRSVARFLSRRDAPEDGRWFCSELVIAASDKANIRLLNCHAWEASPRDVTISPWLTRGPRRVI